MSKNWRLVDTGLRPAAQNIALDRALLEARQADEIPSTLRFLRFTPSALLACDQSAEQEFDIDCCRAGGIAIQRRITGGNPVYTDDKQLDWQLYLHRREIGAADMRDVAKRICHAAATAVSALGIEARFRPRNDIVADGRKISSGGGVFDGDALLYQGTLLVDFDSAQALPVLRFSTGTAASAAIGPAESRFAGLNELLGKRSDPALIKRYMMEAFESEFDVEFYEGDLTLTEHARYLTALAEIDTPDWIGLVRNPASDMPIYEAERPFCGGTLRARLVYDRRRHRVRQVWFGGDVPVAARQAIADLEAALHDASVEGIERDIRMFFTGREVEMQSLSAGDFIEIMRRAVKQPIVASSRA